MKPAFRESSSAFISALELALTTATEPEAPLVPPAARGEGVGKGARAATRRRTDGRRRTATRTA
eukprot:8466551-Pyramimonas_sp.AAC.1